MTTVADLPAIHASAQAGKAQRKADRFARPLVRLWDGNWVMRGVVVNEVSGEFHWLLNDAGTGTLVLPFDHYLARWVTDVRGRTTQNVHVTVDTPNGARWDGRLEKATTKTDDHGVTVVELTFLHSYAEMKFIYCWAHPPLPRGAGGEPSRAHDQIRFFPRSCSGRGNFCWPGRRSGRSKPRCSAKFCA